MPKGPPPAWSRRDCRFDHVVSAGLAQGYGTELVYSGIPSWERADEIRRGVYRCARHRGVTAEAGPARAVTEGMGVRRNRDGTFTLRFRLWDKRAARRAHLQRWGPDRAAWPYDPRRPATSRERETWAARNDTGTPVKGR